MWSATTTKLVGKALSKTYQPNQLAKPATWQHVMHIGCGKRRSLPVAPAKKREKQPMSKANSASHSPTLNSELKPLTKTPWLHVSTQTSPVQTSWTCSCGFSLISYCFDALPIPCL